MFWVKKDVIDWVYEKPMGAESTDSQKNCPMEKFCSFNHQTKGIANIDEPAEQDDPVDTGGQDDAADPCDDEA